MSSPTDRIRVLSATLQPDGSIELELSIPGQDEPIPATIEATKTSKWLVEGGRARSIDLDAEAPTQDDAPLRKMIGAYLVQAERYVAEQRARASGTGRSRAGAR